MKKILLSLIVTGMLFSCNQSMTSTEIVKAPIDSLITNWTNNWNNHDSTGVINMFESSAMLSDDNLLAKHADEISEKWIHPNIQLVNNLKTNKLQDWSTNDRAGYIGTYQLDVIINNAMVAQPKGVFSVNWLKTKSGDWKITTANIHSFTTSN